MREHPTRDPFVPVVRCAADLLAVVPHTLGYWPDDSLVLFATGGGTAGACVRVDLPGDAGDDRAEEAFVAELAELVSHDALSDRVFVIAYTSAGSATGSPVVPPGPARALGLAEDAAERAGRAVAARWVVTRHRWWAVEDPADVRDVAEIRHSAVNAALVAAGSSYAAAPRLAMDHEYGGLPAGTARDVARGSVRWLRAGEGSWHRLDRLAGALTVWSNVLRTVGDARDHWALVVLGHDDDELGFLAAGLSDPVLADLLLAVCATGDLDGVLAAAAMWAELCDEDPGEVPTDVAAEPVGPTRAPTPSAVPPVPRGDQYGRPAGGTAPQVPEPDAGELIRLSRVLAGEWDQPPDWQRLDTLYRVLLSLTWLLDPAGDGTAPPCTGAAREQRDHVLAGVLVELAQLNRFRARGSHTAHFVRRATELVPGHPPALRVLRLAEARPVPLWARDRATAWHA